MNKEQRAKFKRLVTKERKRNTTQNAAQKIKLGYMGKMIDRETAARMLRDIGFTDIDALAYLDKATPHIEFIRA